MTTPLTAPHHAKQDIDKQGTRAHGSGISRKALRTVSIIDAALLVVFLCWTGAVAAHASFIHALDSSAIASARSMRMAQPGPVPFAAGFSKLGSPTAVIIEAVLLALLLLALKRADFSVLLIGTMILADGANWIIKRLVRRQRPSLRHLAEASGYSYPSGHSVGTATLCGILIVIILLAISSTVWKSVLTALLALYALIMGFSRVILQVHYLSDVCAGWINGAFFVLLGFLLYGCWLNARSEKEQAASR